MTTTDDDYRSVLNNTDYCYTATAYTILLLDYQVLVLLYYYYSYYSPSTVLLYYKLFYTCGIP